MPNFTLPYGNESITVSLEGAPIDLILPTRIIATEDPLGITEAALRQPLGGVNYSRWKNADSVAIAINDKTRPVPLQHLLPPLLEKLKGLNIRNTAVTFFVTTGTHKPLSQAEIATFVPADIYPNFQFISHDCDDANNLTYLGRTTRGTPVWLNSSFMSADVRIVIGDIEPHHFMGFSGGAKGAAIGLAGRETINANHSMLIDPLANIAIYDENPMRQDVEEIGDLIGIDLVMNAVLNHEKEIVEVYAGRPRAVMNAGIPRSLHVCATNNRTKYDIVVASAGGYPKDINLYQSQKAISHAALFARPGGTLIVAAECIEGSGSEGFEAFMTGMHSFAEVEQRFRKTAFQIGPHKAYLLARQAAHFNLFLKSSMPDSRVHSFLLNPVMDIGELVRQQLVEMSGEPKIAVLPYATTTLPELT